jgi:hypothetical protein
MSEVQAVDIKMEVVEAHSTEATVKEDTVGTLPPTTDDTTPPLATGTSSTVRDELEVRNKDAHGTMEEKLGEASTSNGDMALQLPNVNMNNEIQIETTTSKPPSLTTAATTTAAEMNGETVDETAKNDRPWDFSNRKVMVQGVDKFHDVKTATKMLHK